MDIQKYRFIINFKLVLFLFVTVVIFLIFTFFSHYSHILEEWNKHYIEQKNTLENTEI